MAVQVMPRAFGTSNAQVSARFALTRSTSEQRFGQRQQQATQGVCSEQFLPSSSPEMAQPCFGQLRMAEGDEQPRYENLDVLGQAIPEDLLMDQFPEIQPAYVTMLKKSEGESTASADTDEKRPPAPLPLERNFLDDLVIRKLQTQQRVKETPTAAVQRKLGYEDTELGKPMAPACKPAVPACKPAVPACKPSATASPGASPGVAGREGPRPKPRKSVPSSSRTSPTSPPAKSRNSPRLGPGLMVSSLTPPQSSKAKSTGVRQLLKLDGQPTEWFHGVITRKEADSLLKEQPVGTFLVRIGERHLGYSLSIRSSKGLKHFMITQREEDEFQLGTNPKIHATMHELVEHFHHSGLNSSGDLLVEGFNYATAFY